MLPRISIVIPSLNQGRFIEHAIVSLLEQDYPGLEIIVVDGRSTDNTTAVIKSFERHLAHWESVGDEGQADAINKGLARSTGEIFNWLNSDDRLENGALKEIGALAAQHPDKELFIGRARIFQDDETIRMSGRIVFGDDETTIGFGQVNQPAMFYRRSALAKIGVLEKRLHMCLDLDLWLRFLLVFGIEATLSSDRAWAAFRLHAASKTVSAGAEFVREKRIIYRNLWEQLGLPADDSVLPPVEMKLLYPTPRVIDAEKCRSCYLLWQADGRSLEQDYREARRLLRRTSFRALRPAEKWRYLAVAKRLWFRP